MPNQKLNTSRVSGRLRACRNLVGSREGAKGKTSREEHLSARHSFLRALPLCFAASREMKSSYRLFGGPGEATGRPLFSFANLPKSGRTQTPAHARLLISLISLISFDCFSKRRNELKPPRFPPAHPALAGPTEGPRMPSNLYPVRSRARRVRHAAPPSPAPTRAQVRCRRLADRSDCPPG